MTAPLPILSITATAYGLWPGGDRYSMGSVGFTGLDAEGEYDRWLDETILPEWRDGAYLEAPEKLAAPNAWRMFIRDDASGLLRGWVDLTIVRALPVVEPVVMAEAA